MKRLHIVSLLIVIIFTGCIEFNLKIELNPDGSGTITEEVLFSQKIISMMESFSKMAGEDAEESFSTFDLDALKAQEKEFGEGVELVKAEELIKKRQTGYSAVYKFNDINTIKVEDDPSSKMPDAIPDQGDSQDEAPFTFKFTKGNPSVLVVNMEKNFEEEKIATDPTAETGETNDAEFEQMKEMFQDMRTSIELKIDGKIVSTDASYVDNNVITLINFDMSKVFESEENIEKLKSLESKDFEEIKGELAEITGIKIELNDQLTVKFK